MIYINDLPTVVANSSLQLFADDCKLYVSAKTDADQDRLQADLSRVHLWCKENQLSLATNKCTVLHIGGRSNPHLQYSLENNILPVVTCMRDLGVLIGGDLRFSEHCSKLAHTASRIVNTIFCAFQNRQPGFLLQMYKVFVRSKLEYASQVWSPGHIKNILLIESVQRNFTKRLAGLGQLDYIERLIALNLEPLELRRIKADLVLVYKIVHNHVNLPLAHFFTLFSESRSVRTRGHLFKFAVPNYRSECRKFYFGNRVVPIWNSLSADTVAAKSITSFQHKLERENLSRFLKVRL